MLDPELNTSDMPKDLNVKALQHIMDVMDANSTSIVQRLVTDNKISSYFDAAKGRFEFFHWNGKTQTRYNTQDHSIANWFKMLNSKRSWILQTIKMNKEPNERF